MVCFGKSQPSPPLALMLEKLKALKPENIELFPILIDDGQIKIEGYATNTRFLPMYFHSIEDGKIGLVKIKEIMPMDRDGRRVFHFIISVENLEHDYGAPSANAPESSNINSVVSDVSSATHNNNGLLTVVFQHNVVFRINSNGKVEQVFPPLQESNSKKWEAISQVTVSPTHRKIAYCKNNNLWVYDMVTKKESQLTHVGKPYTKKLASVEISIKHWSWDDSKILYSVVGGETEDPEGYSPTLDVRPEEYGFHIFDLKLGRASSLPVYIEGELIAGWLENGDFVLNFPSSGHTNRIYQGQFVRFNIEDEHTTASLTDQIIGSDFYQVNISRDGNWLVFEKYIWKSVPQQVQLLKLNLKTKEISAISPVGKFGEYQWPKISPDGKQVAYIHLKSGFYKCDLVVDGKAIYSFDGTGHLQWIDNASLVLFFGKPNTATLMTVIDVETGSIKTEQEWKQ
jgi:hypothetical protein